MRRVGFYAQISERRIGGTYITLVSTIGNIGQTVSNTAVNNIAAWLPEKHAYSIETAGCTVIGIVWLLLSWRMMHRLQALPVKKWHLVKEKDTPIEPDAQELPEATSTINNDK